MPRQRKRVISGKLYQILFRARKDLPLPPTHSMNSILESIVARVQQVYPVILSHFIFMGNHPHILAIPLDADDFKSFYDLVEKELTEAIKKLTGLEYANIWEGSPKVTLIASVDDLVTELGYIYANPATADLEDTIERYPGVSTWQQFLKARPERKATVKKLCPWIRRPMIEKLPGRALTFAQDNFYAKGMLKKAKKSSHPLTISPYAWAKTFHIEDSELPAIREKIIKEVRANEAAARELRREKGKRVIGRNKLRKTPVLAPHKPKKKGPALCVIAQDKDLRLMLLEEFKHFCNLCCEAYEAWRRGDMTVEWPPGAYKPPPPRTVNHFAA